MKKLPIRPFQEADIHGFKKSDESFTQIGAD